MLIKHTITEQILFEKECLSSINAIEDKILEKMNKKYPSNNYTLESIILYNNQEYGTNDNPYFSGKAIIEISQTLPYGQKPSDSNFAIELHY
jgi:hypothetical protein